MATPEFTVPEALKFFSELKLDGAEVIIQSDFISGIPLEASDAQVKEVRRLADDLALPIAATTPYLNLYNSLDEAVRQRVVAMVPKWFSTESTIPALWA